VVSSVTRHQPVFDELLHEGRQLTDDPLIVDEVCDIEKRWNIIRIELERHTHPIEEALQLWTQYIQLVSHLRERLSVVSVKLQTNVRPNMHSANVTLLTNVLQMNQVAAFALL